MKTERTWIHRAGLTLPLLATACMYAKPAPAEDLKVEVPEAWSRELAEGGRHELRWWTSFEDEELERLVAEVLGRNRELGAALQRIRQAQAGAVIAGAEQYPWLSVPFRAGRQRNVFVGIPGPGGAPLTTTNTTYGVSLDLSWELDLWGRIEARKGEAAARLLQTREDWMALAHSLIAQTTKAWFALREARAQTELSAETVESRRKTVDLVEDRYRQGRRKALDVHLARQNLARAETGLALRRGLEDQARFQIEVLLGRYPKGEIEATQGLPGLPEPPPAGLPAEIVLRRPDMRAAEQDLLARRFRISETRAELLPRISLTASAGTTSTEFGDLVDGDFGVWSLFGNLVQPIFQGGRLRAQVDVAEARYREALELFANRLLFAFAEVESALADEHHLEEQRKKAEILVREALRADEISRERYAEGTVGILELLETERALFEAKSFLLDLERQRLSARVDLHLALGGGFEGVEVPGEERAPDQPTAGRPAPEESR